MSQLILAINIKRDCFLISVIFNLQVLLSHRSEIKLRTEFSNNMILKPEVQSFGTRSVVFTDGSEFKIDAVILCTGR